jgi:hypothetical protein
VQTRAGMRTSSPDRQIELVLRGELYGQPFGSAHLPGDNCQAEALGDSTSVTPVTPADKRPSGAVRLAKTLRSRMQKIEGDLLAMNHGACQLLVKVDKSRLYLGSGVIRVDESRSTA